jgi:hypothetical protein
MRRALLAGLTGALALACGGGDTPDPVASEPETTQPPAPATPPVPSADVPSEYGDKYWVILQSDPDPLKAPASLATLGEHPELGATVRRLDSTKFKNLMPCYQVTVAAANADKSAALALSKQLTALGVDNYVKNSGRWLRETAMLDAWCAAPRPAPGHGASAGFVVPIAGSPHLVLDVAPEVYERWLETAGAAHPVGGDLALWTREVSANRVADYVEGASYDVVSAAGARATCTIAKLTSLTVGTPHFGYMGAEEAPAGPGCGVSAAYAQLRCDNEIVGSAAAFSPGSAPPTAASEGPAPDAVATAAQAALTASPGWPTGGDVTFASTTWTLGARRFAVTTGQRVTDGECGGGNDLFFVVHELQSDGQLGAMVVPVDSRSFATLEGLIDLDADGTPEVITVDFTDSVNADGGRADWGWEKPYCDCPC